MIENGIYVEMIDNYSKEELSNKIKITDDTNNIIYTTGLKKCIGILFYIKENNKAFLLHVPSSLTNNQDNDFENLTNGIKEYIKKNNLLNKKISYCIIPGFDCDEKMQQFIDKLLKYYDYNDIFERLEFSDYAAKANIEYGAVEVAYDASTGKFVTHKYFNEDPYFLINNEINYEISFHKGPLELPENYLYKKNIPGIYFHDCIRFRKKELDFMIISNKDIRRQFGIHFYPFTIKDNHIKYNDRNEDFKEKYNFENGYYISKTDNYFDIVEKDKIKEYLDYRYISDVIDKLSDNEVVKISSRIFKIPSFKLLYENSKEMNVQKN